MYLKQTVRDAFPDVMKNGTATTQIALVLALSLVGFCEPAMATGRADQLSNARLACQSGQTDEGLAALGRVGALKPPSAASPIAVDDILAAYDCYRAGGMVSQARELVDAFAAVAEGAGNLAVARKLRYRVAYDELESGDAVKARDEFNLGISGGGGQGPETADPEILIGLGAAYALTDQAELSTETFRKAARVAEAGADQNALLTARLRLARSLVDARKPREAQTAMAGLDESVSAVGEPRLRAQLMVDYGELLARAAEASGTSAQRMRAGSMLAAGSVLAVDGGDLRTSARGLGYLGWLSERNGDLARALAFTRAAIADADQATAIDELYYWQWQSARILAKSGRRAAANDTYYRAIDSLEKIRPRVSRGSATMFQRYIAPLFLEFADFSLGSGVQGKTGRIVADADLREVLRTVERLRSAEVQNYFAEDCVIVPEKGRRLEGITEKTAVIYPIVLADRLEVIVAFGAELRRYTADVSREDLETAVQALRIGLEEPENEQFRLPARQLFDWIVAPFADELLEKRVSTLVYVPDGPLRTVPLAAFYDGEHFVIENFAVAVSPGLTLTNPEPFEAQHKQVLVAGLTEAVGDLPALPGVAAELDGIARAFPTHELRDANFLVVPFSRELASGNYSIVHIASHGVFMNDYRKSFIQAHDGRLTMDQLEATVGMRRYLNEPVELLVLSACETAAGDDRAALGLSGIALKAGARSAVGTLWPVNDDAAAGLVGNLYKNLSEGGTTKAQALQRAQLEMIRDPQFSHPAYWSPFLLIGSWL